MRLVVVRHTAVDVPMGVCYGHLDVAKELLKDKRVDPSDFNNDAIKMSSENNHLGVIKELLKDKRVLNKLSEDDLIKYIKQVENKSNY